MNSAALGGDRTVEISALPAAPARAPSQWTFLSELRSGVWVAHDPAVGGIFLLSEPAAKQVGRALESGLKSCDLGPSLTRVGGFLGPRPVKKELSKTLSVWLSIADNCNMGCGHCYISDLSKFSNSQAQQSMSPEKAIETLEELAGNAAKSGYSRLAVRLAGGEPLLAGNTIRSIFLNRKRIEDQSGIKIAFWLLTNGVMITREIADLLALNNCGVSISMDGDKEQHDRIRSYRNGEDFTGSWDLIWKNVGILRETGLIPYTLITVTPRNLNSILALTQKLTGERLSFRLSLVRDKASHKGQGIHDKMAETFGEIFNHVGNNMSDIRLDKFCKIAEVNLDKPKQGRTCSAGRSNLGVSPSGEVSLCQMFFDKPFSKIGIEGDLIGQMQAEGKKLGGEIREGDCAECRWQFACAGACPRHAFDNFGQYQVPSPWCLTYKKTLPLLVESVGRQMLRILESKAGHNFRLQSRRGNLDA